MRGKRTYDPEQPDKRKIRKWMRVEYYLFLISLVIVIAMTGSGLNQILYVAGAASRDAAAVRENEPEYVSFFHNVVKHFSKGDQDTGSTYGAGTEADTGVDISQFAHDSGYAGQVYALLEEYPEQVEKILSYYENASITVDGKITTYGEANPEEAIPERLLQLVIANIETIDFVADYPENHSVEAGAFPEDVTASDKIPLLIQWDERWGYQEYGDGLIAYTGCGPTCLSMVAIYLTGDTSLTPKVVADYADGAGYYADGAGSAWTLMSEGCTHFGLAGTEMRLSESAMVSQIEAGNPIICAMGEGDFTQSGHFIVITGYENGEFTVNDPNSKIRSAETWSYDRLSGQIRDLWYYTLSVQE